MTHENDNDDGIGLIYEIANVCIGHIHHCAFDYLTQSNEGIELARVYGSRMNGQKIELSLDERSPFAMDAAIHHERQQTPEAVLALVDIDNINLNQRVFGVILDLLPMVIGTIYNPDHKDHSEECHPLGHWKWSQLLHPLVVHQIVSGNDADEHEERMSIHLEQNNLQFCFPGMEKGILIGQGTPAIGKAQRIPTRIVIDHQPMKDLAIPGRKLVEAMEIEPCGVDHIDEAVSNLVIESITAGAYGTQVSLEPAHHIALVPAPDRETRMLMEAFSLKR